MENVLFEECFNIYFFDICFKSNIVFQKKCSNLFNPNNCFGEKCRNIFCGNRCAPPFCSKHFFFNIYVKEKCFSTYFFDIYVEIKCFSKIFNIHQHFFLTVLVSPVYYSNSLCDCQVFSLFRTVKIVHVNQVVSRYLRHKTVDLSILEIQG